MKKIIIRSMETIIFGLFLLLILKTDVQAQKGDLVKTYNVSNANVTYEFYEEGRDRFDDPYFLLKIKPGAGRRSSSTDITLTKEQRSGFDAVYDDVNVHKIEVCEGITVLGEGVFRNMKYLQEVSLPSTLTTIGSEAFYQCRKLEKVDFSQSISEIGSYAFTNCNSLKEAILPDNVEVIPYCCFRCCSELVNVKLPKNCTSIGIYAFDGCKQLKDVILGDQVKEICTDAFRYCPISDIIIPSSVKKIGKRAIDANYIMNITLQDVCLKEDFDLSGCANVLYDKYGEKVSKLEAGTTYNDHFGPGFEVNYIYEKKNDYGLTIDIPTITRGVRFGDRLTKNECFFNDIPGYHFEWCTLENKVYKPWDFSRVITNKDVTSLYAIVVPNIYYVKYVLTYPGESGYQSFDGGKCKYGEEILSNKGASSANTKEEIFVGWNTKEDGSGIEVKAGGYFKNLTTENEGQVVLYSQWRSNTFTVKFSGGSGSTGEMDAKEYFVGKSYKLPECSFAKEGYSFDKWTCTLDGKEYSLEDQADIKDIPAKFQDVITLKAQWKKNAEKPEPVKPIVNFTYTIKYVLNGGKNSDSNPEKYTQTSATIKLKNPSRTGYKFLGWYSDSKFKRKVTEISKGSTGNKTFYAKWAAITYKIKFSANGGKGSMKAISDATYDKKVKLTKNTFKRTGYKFLGWSTNKKAKKADYKNLASVKNLSNKNGATVTLYAIWQKK